MLQRLGLLRYGVDLGPCQVGFEGCLRRAQS
jgi:hypothetical protein